MNIFFSYNHRDKRLIQALRAACKAEGVEPVIDVEARSDQSAKTLEKVRERIRDSSYFLLIVTRASMKSSWVWLEIGLALQLQQGGHERRIIPYIVDESAPLPSFVSQYDRVHSPEGLQHIIRATKPRLEIANRVAQIQKQLSKISDKFGDLKLETAAAETALAKSLDSVLRQHQSNVDRFLGQGVITAFGPALYEMYRHFMEAVESSFRAVTVQDLDYWAHAESRQYLDENASLIERGGSVERIFMLETLSEQRLRAALRPQFERGIRIRLAFFRNCEDLATHNKITDLDFGLFDSFAVSFFRTGHGRGYAITTNDDEIKDYRNTYKEITKRCEPVPGKRSGDATLLASDDDFSKWLKSYT